MSVCVGGRGIEVIGRVGRGVKDCATCKKIMREEEKERQGMCKEMNGEDCERRMMDG